MLERTIEVDHEGHLARAVDAQPVGVKAVPDGRIVPQRLLEGAAEVDDGNLGPAGSVNHRIGILRRELVGREDGVDMGVRVERSEGGPGGLGERGVVRVEAVGVQDDDEGGVRGVSRHGVHELLRRLRLEPVDHAGRQRSAADEHPHGQREEGRGREERQPPVTKDDGTERFEHVGTTMSTTGVRLASILCSPVAPMRKNRRSKIRALALSDDSGARGCDQPRRTASTAPQVHRRRTTVQPAGTVRWGWTLDAGSVSTVASASNAGPS